MYIQLDQKLHHGLKKKESRSRNESDLFLYETGESSQEHVEENTAISESELNQVKPSVSNSSFE